MLMHQVKDFFQDHLKKNYAPLEKGGILFCTYRAVGRSADQAMSAQYLSTPNISWPHIVKVKVKVKLVFSILWPFVWWLPNLLHWWTLERSLSPLIFGSQGQLLVFVSALTS